MSSRKKFLSFLHEQRQIHGGWFYDNKKNRSITFGIYGGLAVGRWRFMPRNNKIGWIADASESDYSLKKTQLLTHRRNRWNSLCIVYKDAFSQADHALALKVKTEAIHVMASLAEVCPEWVMEKLTANPYLAEDTVKALEIVKLLPGIHDRGKFARKWWHKPSIPHCLPSSCKRIHGWRQYLKLVINHNRHDSITAMRYLPNNWKQFVTPTRWDKTGLQNLFASIHKLSNLREEGFGLVAVREIANRGHNYIIVIEDTCRTLARLERYLVEPTELVLLARKYKDINNHVQLAALHDQIHDEFTRTREASRRPNHYLSEKQKLHHLECPLQDTEEVTVLRTEQDFINESSKMHHCVSSYMHRTDIWCVHIETDEESSTAEILSHKLISIQHRGKYNSNPCTKNEVALGNWLGHQRALLKENK